jgi:hypothetical protein
MKMKKKTEITQMVHCGLIVTLKNGKGMCPKCHKTIDAQIKTNAATRRGFKKHDAKSFRTPKDLVFNFGILLLFLFCVLTWNGISYLFSHGLMAFRMDFFTLTTIIGLLGYAIVFGRRKGHRA